MNIKEYKDKLLNFDLKSFLERYTEKDVFRLKEIYPELFVQLAEQIKLYPKAKEKLPEFASNYCYFTTKSYEQSSSEALAQYKAALFRGKTFLDLTGGLGVDDWAFSKSFEKIISVDNDPTLNELVRINFKKLKLADITRLDADSAVYINEDIKADLVYIDADRRTGNKKSVTLEDAAPPILEMSARLLEISDNVLLKLSPLVDLTYLVKSLTNIKQITVISLDNEVKEILVHIYKKYAGEVKMEAVDISKAGIRKYSAPFGERTEHLIISEAKFFYEPASSLIKSGLADSYADTLSLRPISNGGVFHLSNERIKNFFGRSFLVAGIFPFSKSGLAAYLVESEIIKANISKRNFPLTVAELRKLTKLEDGGEDYFFFTQTTDKQKLVYHCKKLK